MLTTNHKFKTLPSQTKISEVKIYSIEVEWNIVMRYSAYIDFCISDFFEVKMLFTYEMVIYGSYCAIN